MKETHNQSERLSVGDILNDSVSTNVFNDNNGNRTTGLKNNFREKKYTTYTKLSHRQFKFETKIN